MLWAEFYTGQTGKIVSSCCPSAVGGGGGGRSPRDVGGLNARSGLVYMGYGSYGPACFSQPYGASPQPAACGEAPCQGNILTTRSQHRQPVLPSTQGEWKAYVIMSWFNRIW